MVFQVKVLLEWNKYNPWPGVPHEHKKKLDTTDLLSRQILSENNGGITCFPKTFFFVLWVCIYIYTHLCISIYSNILYVCLRCICTDTYICICASIPICTFLKRSSLRLARPSSPHSNAAASPLEHKHVTSASVNLTSNHLKPTQKVAQPCLMWMKCGLFGQQQEVFLLGSSGSNGSVPWHERRSSSFRTLPREPQRVLEI